MKSNYIVLKLDDTGSRDVTGGPGGLRTAGAGAGQSVSAEVSTIERNELPTLTRDAAVVAVAPAMPMRLIAPVGEPEPVMASAEPGWGIKAVGAHLSPFSGAGIVVAVLDTGIDATHPAFAGIELVQKDFSGEGNGDGNGHGTHCAGTIFGRDVNGMRIGVAPGVRKALIGKVLGANGGGSSDQVVQGILWAVREGANVISISLGIDYPGAVRRMIEVNGLPPELAASRGLEAYRTNTLLFSSLAGFVRNNAPFAQPTIIVAAAGNESRRDVRPDFEVAVAPPAVSEGFVSVAALGQSPQGLKVAPFSNTGANLSAPGVGIVSASRGGGLVSLSGTSMATPHVAGVAAHWAERLAAQGSLNAFALTARLAGTATSEGLGAGFDPFDVGAGLVQCPRSQ